MTNSAQTCPVCRATIAPGTPICPNCGLVFSSSATAPFEGPPPIVAPPMPGQMLGAGRYTLDRVLSKGGMGAIYLAADHAAFDRVVVVKAMLDYFDPTRPDEVQQARARFLDEARTLAALRHPAIPQIYTYFQDGPHNYIVMEYIEGADLDEGLSDADPSSGATRVGAPYPYEQVLAWGAEVCRVLEYLQSRQPPVVHHDIKPDNLLRDTNSGELRLVDFGTAKARLLVQPGGAVGVQQSSLYGTKGYAAPEQYRGESEPRSDIYALAATLYHLATDDDPCTHPFEFPRLDAMGALGRVLRGALATDATQRPTASELRNQLEELLEPTELHPLEAPDATRLTSAYELAAWCEAHWDDAVKWLRGKLPDQIELLWGKSGLAARARSAIERFGDDGDAALDALLRLLEPGYPPPQLAISPPALDFGGIGLAQPAQRQLTIRNSGRGYALLSLRVGSWLAAEPAELRLRTGQSATVQVRALPQPHAAAGPLSATIGIASQHGTAIQVPTNARLIFQAPDRREIGDAAALVAWCEAHWFDAGLWLASDGPGALPNQVEQLWGDARLGRALRDIAKFHLQRNHQLDAALAQIDPTGYGARAPQITVSPEAVDFGRLEGAARAKLTITNAGRRYLHAPVQYPAWITGGTQSLDLQPGDVREITLNVYPEQIRLDTSLSGVVATAGGLAVPVQARAPLMQRIWWRYPLQAIVALLIVMIVLLAVTVSFAQGRARASLYEKASAALERGDWQGARDTFDELLRQEPGYRDAASLRSETYYRPAVAALAKGDWAGARRELRQVPHYRDADALVVESYYLPLQTALRAQQWERAADGVVALEAINAGVSELPDLLAKNPPLSAAVQRRRWQGDDVAQFADLGGDYFAASADGRLVAVVKSTRVELWRADTADLVNSFASNEPSSIFFLNVVAISPDGTQLAAGGVFGTRVWLWNVAGGSTVELDNSGSTATGRITTLRFSPDGRFLISGDNGVEHIWRLSDGVLVSQPGDAQRAAVVAFSPQADTAAAVYSNTVTLLRASDQTALRTITSGTSAARVVSFSPNGQTLAVMSDDGAVSLWNVADGAAVGALPGAGALGSLHFSPNGETLATVAGGTVRLWRASDSGLIKEHSGADAIFSPDSQTLAVIGADGVTLYRAADGAQLATIANDVDLFDPERASLAFSPDGQTIALQGPGVGLQLWRVSDGTPLQTLPGAWNEGAVAFSADGRTLITSSQGGSVLLWRARPADE